MDRDNDFHRQLLDNLSDGVYFVDRDRKINYWNKGAEGITGYQAEDVKGRRCGDGLLMHVGEDGQSLCGDHCPLTQTMSDGQPRQVEAFLHHADGHRVPVRIRATPMRDAQGRIVGAVEVFDENQMRLDDHARIAELERVALLDPLTELGNRRYAEMMLHAKLGERDRFGRSFGVLFFDIDFFKHINDEHGHETGDRILRMVSRTALGSIRAFDSLSRWGGDEFIAVIAYVGPEQLRRVAEKIRALAAASSLARNQQALHVTLSIGATLAHGDDSIDTLVARADGLMYQAKSAGGNSVATEAEPKLLVAAQAR
jgi:diguanylate cyclase (GGDEF)-like protein/PAS domain S-box-containing protein